MGGPKEIVEDPVDCGYRLRLQIAATSCLMKCEHPKSRTLQQCSDRACLAWLRMVIRWPTACQRSIFAVLSTPILQYRRPLIKHAVKFEWVMREQQECKNLYQNVPNRCGVIFSYVLFQEESSVKSSNEHDRVKHGRTQFRSLAIVTALITSPARRCLNSTD